MGGTTHSPSTGHGIEEERSKWRVPSSYDGLIGGRATKLNRKGAIRELGKARIDRSDDSRVEGCGRIGGIVQSVSDDMHEIPSGVSSPLCVPGVSHKPWFCLDEPPVGMAEVVGLESLPMWSQN